LKDHDPKAAEFFTNSTPLSRLLRATFKIRSIGHLAFSQKCQRSVRDLAGAGIGELLAGLSIADTNQPLSHWGTISLDSAKLSIHSVKPAVPFPQLSSPSFVRRYLVPPTAHETVGDMIGVVNCNIPIYSGVPNTPMEHGEFDTAAGKRDGSR
jgi:hypothetical protein